MSPGSEGSPAVMPVWLTWWTMSGSMSCLPTFHTALSFDSHTYHFGSHGWVRRKDLRHPWFTESWRFCVGVASHAEFEESEPPTKEYCVIRNNCNKNTALRLHRLGLENAFRVLLCSRPLAVHFFVASLAVASAYMRHRQEYVWGTHQTTS